MTAKYPLSLEEALKRLTASDPVEVLFESPQGFTQPGEQPREHVVELLKKAAADNMIEESGYMAQRMNFGIHLPARHPHYGYGWLFIATKPECRVSDQILLEREQARAEELSTQAMLNFAQKQQIGSSSDGRPN